MTRTQYLAALRTLQEDSFRLGEMVAAALVTSLTQLVTRDLEGSRALAADDRLVNARCHELELAALTTIATEAPMASDVRLLAAVMDTANELERVGDYAKGIAHINVAWPGDSLPTAVTTELARMADVAAEMLLGALSAFLDLDPDAARAVQARDDAVDEMFNSVFEAALKMHGERGVLGNGAEHIALQANYLVWVAHNLERSADRATNIAQRVIFIVTGDVADLDTDSFGHAARP
jgi:phosphate transport system protein